MTTGMVQRRYGKGGDSVLTVSRLESPPQQSQRFGCSEVAREGGKR
jgi:hypothetical protein